MIEVLWHGRGGQGAFTAARLLGAAAMEAGLFSLAFPSFGPERRGAPMRAFTKMGTAPIGDRSASSQADFVVYLDETLFGPGWEDELKPGGRVMVNSTARFDDPRIMAIDADGISAAVLGRPIPNTVFLGAIARLSDEVSLADVEAAVRSSMAERLHEPNCAIASQAHEVADGLLTEGEGDWGTSAGVNGAAGVLADAEADAGAGPSKPDVVRAEEFIPRLRSQLTDPDSLDPADYARTTCFTAGHLVTKNAGWRSQRPVVDADACTACAQCIQYCPDGAIYSVRADATDGIAAGCAAEQVPSGTASHDAPSCGFAAERSEASPFRGKLSSRTEVRVLELSPQSEASCEPSLAEPTRRLPVVVDLDFCKGCGICAKMCRFGAIAMVPERQAEADDDLTTPTPDQQKGVAA